jgi:hypothetical protein
VNVTRVRWAVRVVMGVGVAVSVAANVLHARQNPISQAIAAVAPLALLATIELIAKVPVHSRGLAWVRRAVTASLALIAAYVSYWHMVDVARRYGEQSTAAHLIPLTVDGLVIVAWVCLAELAGKSRGETDGKGSVPEGDVQRHVAGRVLAEARREGHEDREADQPAERQEEVAEVKVEPPRKRYPSSADRVVRAHQRTPDATNQEIADRLKVSVGTVKNYRPKREPARVNGEVPHLEEVPT